MSDLKPPRAYSRRIIEDIPGRWSPTPHAARRPELPVFLRSIDSQLRRAWWQGEEIVPTNQSTAEHRRCRGCEPGSTGKHVGPSGARRWRTSIVQTRAEGDERWQHAARF